MLFVPFKIVCGIKKIYPFTRMKAYLVGNEPLFSLVSVGENVTEKLPKDRGAAVGGSIRTTFLAVESC